jgi:riboflavin synthase alpha subunit
VKHKIVISLLVAALMLATVGVAAAAPTEAPRTDTVLGDVKSINGAAFTVTTKERGDVSIQTTDRTRFRAKDNANFSLSDLKVGDRVTVQGRWQDAKLQANVVVLIPANLRDKALGQVQSITGNTLTIVKAESGTLNVVTTAETKFHAKNLPNPTLADIKVGDIVAVVGQLTGETLTASHVGFHTPREKVGPVARGKISAVNGGTLTLAQPFGQALTVTTDANTFVIKRGEEGMQVVTVSDLTVGEGIAVLGLRSSDGKSISARAIIAGKGEEAGATPQLQQPKLPLGQRG